MLVTLPAGGGAHTIPHTDAAAEDALDGTPVERLHSGYWDTFFLQVVEEIEETWTFLVSDVVFWTRKGPQ